MTNPFLFPTLLIVGYAILHFLYKLPKLMRKIARREKIDTTWLMEEILVDPLLTFVIVSIVLVSIIVFKPEIMTHV